MREKGEGIILEGQDQGGNRAYWHRQWPMQSISMGEECYCAASMASHFK